MQAAAMMQPTVPPEQRALAASVREELWFGENDPERTHLEVSRTMAAHAAVATGLKPFPAVAQNALAVLADPDARMKAIVEAIERDPALASRVLRVANSAQYRGARKCSSINEAVVRLGSREVHQVVASVATMGMFQDGSGLGKRWREHLVGVAAVARILGEEHGTQIAGQAFLAGLVHDIGKLLSLQVKEIPYETLAPKLFDHADELHVVERILVGYDHAVLGGHVLSQWRFPETISQVAAWHHQPGRAFTEGGEVGLLVALVRLADAVEYRVGAPLDEAYLDEVARGSAAAYLEIGTRTLVAKWPRFVEAVSDIHAVMLG